MTVLLTDRLRMRPLEEADLDALYALYSDPRIESWIGHHSREDTAVELSFQIAHWSRFGWGLWAVEDRATGEFIGDCGLQPFARVGPEVEVGYELQPERWGAGLGSEAARASVEHGLKTLELDRIIAVVKHGNAASRRVLEKAGLTLTGEREAYGELLLEYEIGYQADPRE